ncbi:MAG: OmpH family outer membrane protein [Planctomycetota bacterium]
MNQSATESSTVSAAARQSRWHARLLLPVVVAAAVGAGAVSMLPANAQDAAPPAPPVGQPSSIAYIDMERVFSDSQFAKEFNARNNAANEAVVGKLQELQRELQTRSEALQEMNRSSQQFKDEFRKLRALELQAQAQQQLANMDKDDRVRDANVQVFKLVERATAAVAQERGIDMIFRKDQGLPRNVEQGTADQVALLINNQRMLYASPGIDVTAAVIAKVDELAAAASAAQ